MPRICKPKPPTTPVFAYFHLPPHVYDAITTYAYKHNRAICAVMQDFMEVGLREYLNYDEELRARFKEMESTLPAPLPVEHLDQCEGF